MYMRDCVMYMRDCVMGSTLAKCMVKFYRDIKNTYRVFIFFKLSKNNLKRYFLYIVYYMTQQNNTKIINQEITITQKPKPKRKYTKKALRKSVLFVF